MSPGAVVCQAGSRPWTRPLPGPGSQEQMLKDIQKASLVMVLVCFILIHLSKLQGIL